MPVTRKSNGSNTCVLFHQKNEHTWGVLGITHMSGDIIIFNLVAKLLPITESSGLVFDVVCYHSLFLFNLPSSSSGNGCIFC